MGYCPSAISSSLSFPPRPPAGITGSKFYTDADGVIVTEVDRLT